MSFMDYFCDGFMLFFCPFLGGGFDSLPLLLYETYVDYLCIIVMFL